MNIQITIVNQLPPVKPAQAEPAERVSPAVVRLTEQEWSNRQAMYGNAA